MGTEVRLISPLYLAPFVRTSKNDRNDAEAIAEAASRLTMRFVPVNSVEQHDIQAAHRKRAILLRNRTALTAIGLTVACREHSYTVRDGVAQPDIMVDDIHLNRRRCDLLGRATHASRHQNLRVFLEVIAHSKGCSLGH
jgi:transposase